MKTLLVFSTCCVALLLGFSAIGHATRPAKLRVPLLSGGEIEVPRSHVHKITPIGWAMMLDRDDDKKETLDAYNEACQQNPELSGKVERLFSIKGKIEGAKRRHPHRLIR